MATTPEHEADAILRDAWTWLRNNADSDDNEGKHHQVRMILAVVLGMCRPFVSDEQLRATLRTMSADVDLWDRLANSRRRLHPKSWCCYLCQNSKQELDIRAVDTRDLHLDSTQSLVSDSGTHMYVPVPGFIGLCARHRREHHVEPADPQPQL